MKVSTCLITMMMMVAFGVTTNAQEWNQPFVAEQYRTEVTMVVNSNFKSTVRKQMGKIQRKSGMKFSDLKLNHLKKQFYYADTSSITSTIYDNDAQQWKVIDYATMRLGCVSGFQVDFEKQPSIAIGTYFAIKDLNPTKREAGKATDFVRSKTLALLKFNADRICKNAKKPLRTHLALPDDELGWY